MPEERFIQKAPIKRYIREKGIGRVSDEAINWLADVVEDFIKRIADEAIKVSKETGKKNTVKKDDLVEAAKRIKCLGEEYLK